MSFQAVRWALDDAPMLTTEKGKPDTTARLVLVALADRADDDGTNTFPSPLRIHWTTGLDERTIRRALARLEKAGLIVSDGTARSGATKWRVALDRKRGDAFELHLEAAEKVRRAESERRQARRDQAAIEAVSGTQNPGPPTGVRDAESRRPGVSVPASGTQNPDVRDATPPEESVDQTGTNHGGTLPPDPLRRDAPSGRLNDQANSPRERGTSQLGPAGDPPPARASPENVIDFASRRRKDHPPGKETA